MPRLESQAKGGYYPTPDAAITMLLPLLQKGWKDGDARTTTKAVDPCCGTGAALDAIAAHARDEARMSIRTYGIELNSERAQAANRRLDRIISADLFSTSIANDAFGLLFLNPPYDNEVRSGDDDKKRTETAFLQKCTPYLKPAEGVLVYIIPRRILSASARFLAANYHNLTWYDFPDPERQAFNQSILLGIRKENVEPDPGTEYRLAEWSNQPPQNEPELPGPEAPVYPVPPTDYREVLFTSLFFDAENIADEADTYGLWTNRAFTGAVTPPVQERRRPLLPLRQGHVATLTAAGFLDNMELEDEEAGRILVKGRSYKEPVLVESTPEKEVHREVMKHEITALNLTTGEFEQIKS